MKKIAVIDLGTNTFNLLIVSQTTSGFTEDFSTKMSVGLGLGGINENRIQEDAIQRALTTLVAYKAHCVQYNVENIVAFGTSAIRNASNSTEFVQKVKEATGIHVQIISGKREAELIYKGVRIGLETPSPFIIMDIGGGSTEFILGDNTGMIEAASFEIGAARIYQKFQFSDPFTEDDCNTVRDYLTKGTGNFFDTINVSQLIGASGSFETFYELLSNKAYPKNEFVTLKKADLMQELERIIFSTKAEREADNRIIAIRKKMAPIAALKIQWIIRKLNIENVIISPYALKEGVISEQISLISGN